MKPPFDIAADLDTPVSAYLKLGPFRPRYLLESVAGGERVGRYSFLGFGDALHVRLADGVLTVGDATLPEPADADALLDALRTALDRCPRPGPPVPGLPFQGGLVGAASFDVVRRFERLPAQADPSDDPELAYVGARSLLVFDHATRRAALLHDGPEAERVALRDEVIAALRGPVPWRRTAGWSVSEPVPTMSRAAYVDAVRTVQEHIRAGDVYQLVPSVGFSGHTSVPPFEAYRALRLLNPSPYMVYIDLGDTVIVGSSPEALVKLDGDHATLRPIAGTRPRGATEAEDVALEAELLADPKEASEHVMLVDLARNDLGRVAVAGTVHVAPSRVIERYSHVMHIVSGVQGTVAPGRDVFDLFAATFPAGTVVGAPKVRAMEILDALEPVRRGIYAGTVGYFGHGGTMDQAIAIRTMVFRDGTYRIQAGAGVVADSVPEREHDEVLAKARALHAALALAVEGL
ncbi:MAG: anthranilate synthase component I family protein [Alphaproteobacteria bacterium]|nr:anthranilate synthase component I family protein [Alphaproteobacteria bacterium]